MRMILSEDQYDVMIAAVRDRALEKNPSAWFDDIDGFEDWAGDVFYDLLDAALRSINVYCEDMLSA